MKKVVIIIAILCLALVAGYSFSSQEIWTIKINQTELKTSSPVLNIDGVIYLPLESSFKTLGAQVHMDETITAYHLNSFLKIDMLKMTYSINGKTFKFKSDPFYKDGILYVPVKLLTLAFDLVEEAREDETLYLKANTGIQYKFFENMQYKQVSFDEEGIRFSIPLDWQEFESNQFGYDSRFGRTEVEYTAVALNPNINLDVVMRTYEDQLFFEYPTNIKEIYRTEVSYNHLTNTVLYMQIDVNDTLYKKRVHFIPFQDYIYILDYQYPQGISDVYINRVILNMMNSFHVDSITYDPSDEHYIETHRSLKAKMSLDSQVFANMTVENKFNFTGSFDTEEVIDSLTIQVSRGQDLLEFYVDVKDNHFSTWIYTPFGLGKHNIAITITKADEKVVFDHLGNEDGRSTKDDLLYVSVVNVSNTPQRYLIPTKMVQSQHEYMTSMSQLLTYKNNTSYSKARSIYDFISSSITILDVNTTNYTAVDVYLEYEGTTLETLFYTTALLRAQNIPARIISGSNNYAQHYWIEANINGSWAIIDPAGDQVYTDLITDEVILSFPPTFQGSRDVYDTKYPFQIITDY